MHHVIYLRHIKIGQEFIVGCSNWSRGAVKQFTLPNQKLNQAIKI